MLLVSESPLCVFVLDRLLNCLVSALIPIIARGHLSRSDKTSKNREESPANRWAPIASKFSISSSYSSFLFTHPLDKINLIPIHFHPRPFTARPPTPPAFPRPSPLHTSSLFHQRSTRKFFYVSSFTSSAPFSRSVKTTGIK